MKRVLVFALVIVSVACQSQRKDAQSDSSLVFQPSPGMTNAKQLAKAGIPENCLDGLKPTTQLPESFAVSSREAFRCGGLYSDKSWLKGALLNAMEQTTDTYGPEPYWALVFYYQYAHQPWAAEVFTKAVKLDPAGTFVFFAERSGFNGNHDPVWYDERVPGLISLLRSEVETSVDKGNGVQALEFLVRERDFPDREVLLKRVIPELLVWEELRSLALADIARSLHEIKEPYAVDAIERLKAETTQRSRYFRRVLAGS